MTPEFPKSEGPTVVGIGASAGGLAALKVFLDHVPADSGLAFVVVVHLSPDHESHLAELLQPHARIPVEQVTHNTLIEQNRVYIIPPNANLHAIDTHLQLTKLEELRHARAPIDHFFRTLAGAQDGNAVAVVLTGTGSDGTLGVKDIKANGGVVIVQDPLEAEYDGMPQSAIATGLVDFVLPVAEIPNAILRFDRVKPRVPRLADEQGMPPDERALLHKVFRHLRVRTERDFSRYKRSTVLRRISRRMQLNYMEDLGRYVERLRDRPDEVRALADDLLITVTTFFRDKQVFERLERVEIPRLFNQRAREVVRAWSVGCATGEEAYSIAMLLVDEAARHDAPQPQLQVFASDLHTGSLERAREGFYPGAIESDVSAERLKQFFQKENGGYRIRKELRDLVLFAPHNLLADPPFSRLDLIACRNLLIYLDREVQQDVIELFHYALNPDGVLVLGSAETTDATDLFRVEDKKLCVFRKRNVPPREPGLPVFPLARTRLKEAALAPRRAPATIVYGNVHQRMLEQHAPPSILIDADNRIVHLSENAGRYLVLPGGLPTQSVIKMVREELRLELQTALHQARESKETLDSKPIPVRFNGHSRPVVLHVRPSREADEEGFALIIFEERDPSPEAVETSADPDGRLAFEGRMESQLSAARQRLQATVEEYETNREEMKASNEELQSMNEELRSTMEELETSKEELQSINEELQTVNQQNRHKVEELAQLSSDLQNLLAAADIATLFLDRDLRILRFTPRLGDLFNIRVTDRGRPISDLTHRLGYPELNDDAHMVLANLTGAERELTDDAGRWYLTRMHPYRSNEGRIDGVVVTFVNITDRKERERMHLELQRREQADEAERAMRQKEAELARVARTLTVGELAASIAHEVNQPLAGVVTNAEAGLRWLEAGEAGIPEARNSLSMIVRDGNRASAVTRRVREFVKNESDGSEPLDLAETVRETVTFLQFDIQKHGVDLELDLAETLPAVHGDRVQIEQVVLNVVANAFEAMAAIAEGQRKLKITAAQSDSSVVLAIRDSGVGIDPALIDRVYDPFFTTKPSGIGMGLSICRSIVEAHGGEFSLLPNENAGLTVQFSLPIIEANETSETETS